MTDQKATKPDLSRPVTKDQWEVLEQYYIQLLDVVHIPEDPKPQDILSLNAKLEDAYHQARLDFYYTSRAFEKIESGYRKIKRALQPIAGKNSDGTKAKNAEEREHNLQHYLMQTTLDQLDQGILTALGIPPAKSTIYALYDLYKERVDFMKTVLDLINDKTSRLITDSGAMKIETKFK